MEKNWIILTEISDQLENLNNYPIYLEELLNNLEKQVNTAASGTSAIDITLPAVQ